MIGFLRIYRHFEFERLEPAATQKVDRRASMLSEGALSRVAALRNRHLLDQLAHRSGQRWPARWGCCCRIQHPHLQLLANRPLSLAATGRGICAVSVSHRRLHPNLARSTMGVLNCAVSTPISSICPHYPALATTGSGQKTGCLHDEQAAKTRLWKPFLRVQLLVAVVRCVIVVILVDNHQTEDDESTPR